MKELTEIYEYCKENNLLEEVVKFQCFADGMITYGKKGLEITLIVDDILLKKHTVKELLNTKRKEFFELKTKDFDKYYTINANTNLN